MGNVASLELCKELYELSGWDDTPCSHVKRSESLWPNAKDDPTVFVALFDAMTDGLDWVAPAYTLGYLLRKLPKSITDHMFQMGVGDEGWAFGYMHSHAEIRNSKTLWVNRLWRNYRAVADTPEDAACKLAIELFKQGILTKEPS